MEYKKTISSDLTFIHKFIFPSLMLGAMALLAVYFIVQHPENTALLEIGRIAFILFLLFMASVYFYLSHVPIKRIELQNNRLIISNYWKSISVPVTEIETITENASVSFHPIWIYLKHETIFGNRIMFVPHTTLKLFGSHPIVKELNELSRSKENREGQGCGEKESGTLSGRHNDKSQDQTQSV
jgi:hypothetical protein